MSFKFTHTDWFAWVFITSNNIYFYSDENEFHIFSWIKHVACHFWSTTVHMIIHAHNKMNKNGVAILKSLLVKWASNIFAPLNTGKFLTLKYFYFFTFFWNISMWAFISSILDKYPIWIRKRGWHYYMFIKVCAKDSKSNVCLCTSGNLIMFSIKTQIDYIQFVDLFKIYFFSEKKNTH